MVGNAGIIEAEVVLVSKSRDDGEVRWVYLDIGKFGGLAETMDDRSAIRSAPSTRTTAWSRACSRDRPATRPTFSTREPYMLPFSLEIGDKVLIEGTGAYTTTYSAVAFNGFPPLKTHVI